MSKGNGIKKCSYEYIRKNIFKQYILPKLHFHVEQLPQGAFGKDTYIITAYHEGKYYTLCMGKSLKGYEGDIIHLKYDGYCYPCGDYLLVSEEHGLICKFKRSTEEFLADLKPQINAKKKEIAIYKQNNGEENPKLLEKINECREEICQLLIKRDRLTRTENAWATSPTYYYHGKIEEWVRV